MPSSSSVLTPDGRNWDNLANYAGGKQSDGIMGISIAYIRSRHFLKGDGGIENLVWVDSELKGKIKDIIPKGRKLATEEDVSNVAELREFVGR